MQKTKVAISSLCTHIRDLQRCVKFGGVQRFDVSGLWCVYMIALMRERSDGSNNPSLIRDAVP